MGRSWALLGRSWAALGALLLRLDALMPVLTLLGGVFGPSWAHLAQFQHQEPLGTLLGRSWGALEALLGRLRAPQERPKKNHRQIEGHFLLIFTMILQLFLFFRN